MPEEADCPRHPDRELGRSSMPSPLQCHQTATTKTLSSQCNTAAKLNVSSFGIGNRSSRHLGSCFDVKEVGIIVWIRLEPQVDQSCSNPSHPLQL